MPDVHRCDERLNRHLLLPASTTNQYQTNDADLPEGRSFGLGSIRARSRIERVVASLENTEVPVAGVLCFLEADWLLIECRD